jgi:hypothetical protein
MLLRRGRPLRTLSPCCSTNWSVDSPNRCSARRVFPRRLKTGPRPGAPSWQKPRSQPCGSSGLGSDREVRLPNRSKSCPLKYGPVFSRYWNPPPAAWARSHGRRGSPAPALRWAKAFCAPFDNLSRSWDINPSTVPRSRSRVNREHGRSFRRSVAAPATVSGVPTHLSPLDFSQVREGGVGDTLRARRPAVRRRIPQNRRRGGRGVLMTGPQNPDLALRQLLAGSD